jgi:hypothetical protein
VEYTVHAPTAHSHAHRIRKPAQDAPGSMGGKLCRGIYLCQPRVLEHRSCCQPPTRIHTCTHHRCVTSKTEQYRATWCVVSSMSRAVVSSMSRAEESVHKRPLMKLVASGDKLACAGYLNTPRFTAVRRS